MEKASRECCTPQVMGYAFDENEGLPNCKYPKMDKPKQTPLGVASPSPVFFPTRECLGQFMRISTNLLFNPVIDRHAIHAKTKRFTRNYSLAAWPQESNTGQLGGK